MHILLEGPDGGGKTTLAKYLSDLFNMPIEGGKGPPKKPGEIVTRARSQLNLMYMSTPYIHDRTPIVSQPIYSRFRQNRNPQDDIPMDFEFEMFLGARPLVIYVKGEPELKDHTIAPHDTPSHAKMVEEHQGRICNLYDQWASRWAHITYNRFRGDDMEMVGRMVKGAIQP